MKTDELKQAVEKRRTFAIISHPDAGKTTITEQLLLFGGVVRQAGTVKAKKSGNFAKSDWMEIEKKRGISVTSSVMQFDYDGKRVNIPSYRVKIGDVIALYEGSRSSEKFKTVVEQTAGRVVPLWLEPNKADFAAKVVRMPVPEDLDYETQTHLIVELYSK